MNASNYSTKSAMQDIVNLRVEQWCVDQTVPRDNVRADAMFDIVDDGLAHLRYSIWAASQQLQDKAVFSHPANFWHYVLRALGLKYKATRIRLRQRYVFPEIPVPGLKVGASAQMKTDYEIYTDVETSL